MNQRALERMMLVTQIRINQRSKMLPLNSMLGRIHLTNFHMQKHLHRQPRYAQPQLDSSSEESNSRVPVPAHLPAQEAIHQLVMEIREASPQQPLMVGLPPNLQILIPVSHAHQLALALLDLPASTQAPVSRSLN